MRSTWPSTMPRESAAWSRGSPAAVARSARRRIAASRFGLERPLREA
jgi:hypothetical protein